MTQTACEGVLLLESIVQKASIGTAVSQEKKAHPVF